VHKTSFLKIDLLSKIEFHLGVDNWRLLFAMSTFFELINLNPYREETLDEEEFLELVQKDPGLCNRKYKFDSFEKDWLYALHMVCALNGSLEAVKECYKANHAALTEDHDDNALGSPLHFACAFGASVDVVRYLAKKDPKSLTETNQEKQQTPLHLAASGKVPDLVIFLTEKCPEAAAMQDKDGNTPLNLACRAEEPILAIIEDLTEVNAAAGVMKADDGTWPLFNAMKSTTEPAVLKDLIVSNHESSKIISFQKKTVLHQAIENKIGLPTIKDLIKVFPEALDMKDDENRTPLQLALETRSHYNVISHLVKKNPSSVEQENEKGEIPFQTAERLGFNEEIVQFLNPYEEVEE
jgi:ankyrin repeat protein